MTTSATEGFFGALAGGAETYVRETSPQAVTDRASARFKQQQMQRELEQQQYQDRTGSWKAEVDAVRAQNEDLMNKIAKQDTFNAFQMYSADYDPRHLMRAIHTNPVLRDIYSDVVSIDKIDPANDTILMRNSGLDETNFDPNRYLKVTRPDGRKDVMDMLEVYKGTGYLNQVSNQELERLLKESQINKNNKPPSRGGKSSDKGTAMERNAAAVAAARDRIEAGVGSSEDEELIRMADKEQAGVIPGKFRVAAETKEALFEEFGGVNEFYGTNFSVESKEGNTNYMRAIPYVRQIEELEGIDLTSAQKTQLSDIRALIALGDPAAEITDAETGLIDNMLLNFKKYVSDEVGGLAATSAYASFRNSVRHALYGAALTDAEIKSFNESFATLGQKTGPVLEQFKTAMQQVKANLNSIARMTSPISAKVRLGMDQEGIDRIIAQIDRRIQFLNSKAPIAPEKKQRLDSIFKGGNR